MSAKAAGGVGLAAWAAALEAVVQAFREETLRAAERDAAGTFD
jgi:hypothetical protein